LSYSKDKKFGGFTIVEVIIVIAIAGIILAIIFLAVPALQRGSRDNYRRNYAARVLAAIEEYHGRNLYIPTCKATTSCTRARTEAARFITSYEPEGYDPATGESYIDSTTHLTTSTGCGAVATTSDSTVYCYNATTGASLPHTQFPRVGQLIIATQHFCCPCTGGSPTNSIWDGGSAYYDSLDHSLAILIGVENGQYYCVDNYK